MSPQEAYNELAYYTLSHPDSNFIHQHMVDAFGAQYAVKKIKPIAITFALVGLYLYLERGFTGNQVQRAHMQLAKEKREWPVFTLPEQRGEITVFEVLYTNPGKERDEMIKKWCLSVWQAYGQSHQKIINLLGNFSLRP